MYTLYGDPGILQDAEVVGNKKINDHRLIRAKVTVNLKRARTRLMQRNRPTSVLSGQKQKNLELHLRTSMRLQERKKMRTWRR